jgi:hypothetical protein
MAQPSSERERDREKDRYRSSSSHHHHHRTISSTTLLLALSLILAVLAITLTIPSYSSSTPSDPSGGGVLGYLNPKRGQGLLVREQAVAMREAEVARREAELLAGSPAGVAAPPSAITAIPNGLPVGCAPPTLSIVTQTVTLESYPVPTMVKEVVKEIDAPSTVIRYADPRIENLFEREGHVSNREREVSNREEVVGKREVDASRREQWIMDQLMYVSIFSSLYNILTCLLANLVTTRLWKRRSFMMRRLAKRRYLPLATLERGDYRSS